jgi:hypothetical protein
MSKKIKTYTSVSYPSSARRPLPHRNGIPNPTFSSFTTSSDGDSCVDTNADSNDENFVVSGN